MTSRQIPTFESAADSFHKFISEKHQCSDMRWIFREDIVHLGRYVFVRLPLPDAEDVVEQRYKEGVERGLGINLHAYCFLDGHALCYIWLPKDQEDADYQMLSGLKLSIIAEPKRRKVVGVTSKLRWRWLCWLGRHQTQQWGDEIPCRVEDE